MPRVNKNAKTTKSDSILVRLVPGEKRAFQDAADVAGIPMSSWVRDRLRRAARRELEEVGQNIAFLPPGGSG